jgi:hypothetical protein
MTMRKLGDTAAKGQQTMLLFSLFRGSKKFEKGENTAISSLSHRRLQM